MVYVFSGSTTGQIFAASGSVSAPGIAFASDPLRGFYITGASTIGVAINGASPANFTNSAFRLGTTRLSFGANGVTEDTILNRDAVGALALRNGTSAQIFRVYRTQTDESNYERATFGWSGTSFHIGPEAAGTGTKRDIFMTSNVRLLTGARFIGYRQGVTFVHSGPDPLALNNTQSGALICSDDLAAAFTVHLPNDPQDGVTYTICHVGTSDSGPIVVNSGSYYTIFGGSLSYGVYLEPGASVTVTYVSTRGAWVVTGSNGTVGGSGA